MDIIIKQATSFANNYFNDGVLRYEEILDSTRRRINEIDNPRDKIKFLNVVLEKNNSDYKNHKQNCKEPENCIKNFSYETISYYLTQELNRLGVYFNDDTFTEPDIQEADDKLERILKELNDLKIGQQIIYDDIVKELCELKELFFLGKKKWYQLLIGKSVEMVASGIVSETVSKEILKIVNTNFPTFLGN